MTVHNRYLDVNGLRTHYLEGGVGTPVVLLHGADFGTSAAMCWEPNLGPFAERFHVIAPDLLGYGETAKIYSFEDMRRFRLQHLEAFLRAHCLGPAWLIGNSAGASMALELAADAGTAPMVAGIVAVAGGGPNSVNEGRRALDAYDGSLEGMARILGELFHDPAWASGAYLERRHEATMVAGLFECFAAGRITRPGAAIESGRPRVQPNFSAITAPTLIVGGSDDRLKPIAELEELTAKIAGSEMLIVEHARHWPHVEYPALFNEAAFDFVDRRGG